MIMRWGCDTPKMTWCNNQMLKCCSNICNKSVPLDWRLLHGITQSMTSAQIFVHGGRRLLGAWLLGIIICSWWETVAWMLVRCNNQQFGVYWRCGLMKYNHTTRWWHRCCGEEVSALGLGRQRSRSDVNGNELVIVGSGAALWQPPQNSAVVAALWIDF